MDNIIALLPSGCAVGVFLAHILFKLIEHIYEASLHYDIPLRSMVGATLAVALGPTKPRLQDVIPPPDRRIDDECVYRVRRAPAAQPQPPCPRRFQHATRRSRARAATWIARRVGRSPVARVDGARSVCLARSRGASRMAPVPLPCPRRAAEPLPASPRPRIHAPVVPDTRAARAADRRVTSSERATARLAAASKPLPGVPHLLRALQSRVAGAPARDDKPVYS